jgi:predicted dehydrogenase
MTQTLPPPTEIDTGHLRDGGVVFAPWRSQADTPAADPPKLLPPARRIGVAVVGLGRLALEEILPALMQSTQARLAALVSGTPEKLALVAEQYGIPAASCYDYADFDRIANDGDVQIVYIALPNAMHRSFVERAAKAGKHVLCEKPMATNSADASAMTQACRVAGVKLMIGYRMHFEPYHELLRSLIAEGKFGRLVGMTLTNVQTVAPDGDQQWRHKAVISGGGALPDIGLYLLNSARYLTDEEPDLIWAAAHSPAGDARYADVEETLAFTLRFPSGVFVQCFTSYGARDDKYARLNFELATVEITNAYTYSGQRMTIVMREGDHTSRNEVVLSETNQFATEIDHFARCVTEGTDPAPGIGCEGGCARWDRRACTSRWPGPRRPARPSHRGLTGRHGARGARRIARLDQSLDRTGSRLRHPSDRRLGGRWNPDRPVGGQHGATRQRRSVLRHAAGDRPYARSIHHCTLDSRSGCAALGHDRRSSWAWPRRRNRDAGSRQAR